MSLRIAANLSLPSDAALWTFADLAIKGAGKTYAASVLAEEMVKDGTPIVAIDSMGIWWGLRVGVDNHEGLPIVVFGGSHKDLSIPVRQEKNRPIVDEDRLKLMVKAILEAGVSAILDTSEFSKNMQRRIVTIFVNELYHLNAPYGVRHVFIEEADQWCPQKLSGDVTASAGAIDDLVRRGGNFNLGCTLITQRSAVLNKDVLTQANCLIVLRILHKLDKKAVETWVESMARPDDPRIKKWYDSLRDLKDGEAWIWHPQTKLFERIQFRKRETLHATREYFRQAEFEQKDIRMMDVASFITKFRAVFDVKPRPERSLIGQQPGVPVPLVRSREVGVIGGDPVVPTGNPSPPQTIDILRSNPVVQTVRSLIGIVVPGDADHPKTALGKIAVVMKDDSRHSQHWTLTRVEKQFKARQWPLDGIEEAFNQLISWGILRIQSNKAYTFYASRVEITEKTVNVIAP